MHSRYVLPANPKYFHLLTRRSTTLCLRHRGWRSLPAQLNGMPEEPNRLPFSNGSLSNVGCSSWCRLVPAQGSMQVTMHQYLWVAAACMRSDFHMRSKADMCPRVQQSSGEGGVMSCFWNTTEKCQCLPTFSADVSSELEGKKVGL